jgi:hypothetical protein
MIGRRAFIAVIGGAAAAWLEREVRGGSYHFVRRLRFAEYLKYRGVCPAATLGWTHVA